MHDLPDCLVQLSMRKDSKKGKYMHSLSVSVFPCLSETMCARTFCIYVVAL